MQQKDVESLKWENFGKESLSQRPRQREKTQAEAKARPKAKTKSLLRDKVKSMKIKELWDTLPEAVQKEVSAMSRNDRTEWTNKAVVRTGGRLFLDQTMVTEVLNRTKELKNKFANQRPHHRVCSLPSKKEGF